jgi:predicted  nucleic acid-binding Zn-ribbon protein
LLEKIAKRNLQLDGLYNSDSLCFVLSQTDKEFNYKNYIKQTPVLNESTVEDSKEIRRLMGDIGALKRQRDNTKKKYNEKKKLAKKLSKETVDIKSRLDALSNSAGNLSHNRKRTANETEAGE